MDPTTHIDLAVASKSTLLKGKSLTVCAGGGIAAIELPQLARELRRHGARVRFVVTENALRFVGAESLEWASAHPVTVVPTGFAEHIAVDDAVVVFPATADLIGKIASGLCTDGPTTLIQSALGQRKPVILCPTMHESLASSPFVQANRNQLAKSSSLTFVPPRIEEGKEKAPRTDLFALEISHALHAATRMKGQAKPRVVVTFGGTRASLDAARCVTNLSTGALGAQLIKDLFARGAEVTAIEAGVSVESPAASGISTIKAPEFDAFKTALETLPSGRFHGIFHIAAVSDFVPSTRQGKIESAQDELTLVLKKSPKLIELPHLQSIPFRVGCKLTAGGREAGLTRAKEMLSRLKLNHVLWNTAESALQGGGDDHRAVLLSDAGGTWTEASLAGKKNIAEHLSELFFRHHLGDHS